MYNNYDDELMKDLRDFEEYMNEKRESEKINNETEKH